MNTRLALHGRFMEFANVGNMAPKAIDVKDFPITNTAHVATVDDVLKNEQLLNFVNERDERKHLTGYELDALVQISIAKALIVDAEKSVEKYAKDTECWSAIRTAHGMLRKACKAMAGKLDFEQVAAVHRNVETADISISGRGSIGQHNTVCMDSTHLRNICEQAVRQCGATCTCNEVQSRKCVLRRAYDSIPGMKQKSNTNSFVGNECPYQMLEVL